MAIPLTLAQLNSIKGPALTLCRTWDFVRKDGKALYLTDHDRPIVFSTKRYVPVRSITSTATTKGGGFQPRDKEYKGAIDTELIKEEELLAGLYKDCYVKECVVDWNNLSNGQFLTDVYWFKTLSFDGRSFTAGVEGLSGWTDKPFGRNYTRDCVYNLGDRNCRVDVTPWVKTGTVTGITDGYSAEFLTTTLGASPSNVYRQSGILVWTGGLNAGLSHVISGQNDVTHKLSLWIEPIFPVAVGDAFTVYPGCDKLFTTCKDTFSNYLNFGGFPNLIGNDEFIATPDSNG